MANFNRAACFKHDNSNLSIKETTIKMYALNKIGYTNTDCHITSLFHYLFQMRRVLFLEQ